MPFFFKSLVARWLRTQNWLILGSFLGSFQVDFLFFHQLGGFEPHFSTSFVAAPPWFEVSSLSTFAPPGGVSGRIENPTPTLGNSATHLRLENIFEFRVSILGLPQCAARLVGVRVCFLGNDISHLSSRAVPLTSLGQPHRNITTLHIDSRTVNQIPAKSRSLALKLRKSQVNGNHPALG